MNEFQYVNNSGQRRVDGMEKVTGKALYAGDVRMNGMLYAKGVYAEYAHAEILSVDKSEALAMEGVVDVVTAADLPGKKTFGEVVDDEYPIADDKTRMYGDVVAVVAAETPEIAAEAVKKVKVRYGKILPALFSPKEAMEAEGVNVTDRFPGNVYCEYRASFGDVEKGFAESDVILEKEYKTGYQEHAYTEREAVIGIPDFHERGVTVYGCLQNLFMARESVARCLDIPFSRVIIRQTVIGGSFGGKQESTVALAVRAALLAVRTKRPVMYEWTREESFRESFKRHPFEMKIKIGCTKDGYLKAMQGDFISDAGAYVNKSKGIMGKAITLGMGPYKNFNTLFVGHPIMTNNIHTGSYQGFGNPQGTFARECAMTEMAEKLGLSPYQFRKMNVLRTGDYSGTGQLMDWKHMGAEDVLDAVAKEIDFDRKYWKYKKENHGDIRRGVGLSLGLRGNSVGASIQDNGRVYIMVEEDGSVLVNIGLAEIGQGLYTTMRIMAAEALCCDIGRVTISDADTSRSPLTGAALASRGTYLGGHAIRKASAKIHDIIKESLTEKYGVPAEEIRFENDSVWIGGDAISFTEACKICYDSGRTAAAVGDYKTPPLKWDSKTGTGEPFYMYTFSAAAVEVEVDMATGKTQVLRCCAAHDIGRAIFPQGAAGQISGGLIGAQGWALTEDMGSKDGVIRHLNYDNYIIPTTMDIGEIVPIIVENPDPRGVFGANSLGEPAFDPCGAAYVNAVNCAMGHNKHIRSLPANLEAVFFCEEDED